MSLWAEEKELATFISVSLAACQHSSQLLGARCGHRYRTRKEIEHWQMAQGISQKNIHQYGGW